MNNHISCAKCGSHAINEHLHGRKAGKHPELCDVCYWRAEYSAVLNPEPPAEVPPEPIVYTGIHPFTHQPMRATMGNFDSSGGKFKDMEQRIRTLESEIQRLKECLDTERR